MILPYNGKHPVIGNDVFIAPSASVIGDVVIEDGASVWYGATVRGDLDRITIGPGTNVQDNCTLHVDNDAPLTIGAKVTIGHNAVVHGCTIEDNVLIGIGAVVLNKALIHSGSVVAAGAMIGEGMRLGPLQLAAGVPAKVKKDYPADWADHLAHEAEIYIRLAKAHRKVSEPEV